MSMIVAHLTVMLLTAAPAVPPRVTAEQVMTAHRAATSIGADPCRAGAGAGAEIVVCGRRESPYALPLYEPATAGDGLPSGMARETAIGTARDMAASCHARGEGCTKPLPVIGIPVGAGKKGGVRIGQD